MSVFLQILPHFMKPPALPSRMSDAAFCGYAFILISWRGHPSQIRNAYLFSLTRGVCSITISWDCSSWVSPTKTRAFNQLVIECRSQIQRFLSAFPDQQLSFQLDSHQHVHAVPIVYRALAQALAEENCLVKRLREPIDPLPLYRTCVEGDSKESAGSSTPQARNTPTRIPMVNRVKIFLISALWRKCSINDIPWAPNRPASAPLFSGVALSGRMDEFSKPLLASFQHEATRQNRDAEILFHPISVPIEKCLDPLNKPFAEACASVSRNHEAELIRKL